MFNSFLGRKLVRDDKVDPTSPHPGASLEKEIDRALVGAASDAECLSRARAEQKKQHRAEERAIIRMLSANYKREP